MNLTTGAAFQSLRKSSQGEDPIWDMAVEWVMREHNQLGEAELEALTAWLEADPAHLAAYEEASYLWKLCGIAMSGNDNSS